MTSLSIQYKMGKGNVKHLALICADNDQYSYFFGTVLGILDKIKSMRERRLWIDSFCSDCGLRLI